MATANRIPTMPTTTERIVGITNVLMMTSRRSFVSATVSGVSNVTNVTATRSDGRYRKCSRNARSTSIRLRRCISLVFSDFGSLAAKSASSPDLGKLVQTSRSYVFSSSTSLLRTWVTRDSCLKKSPLLRWSFLLFLGGVAMFSSSDKSSSSMRPRIWTIVGSSSLMIRAAINRASMTSPRTNFVFVRSL